MTTLVHSDVYSTQHNICWFFSDLRKLVVSPTPQIKLITIIKWKKIYHTVRTIPKSSIRIIERGKFDIPNTQIHDRWLPWLGTGSSINSGGDKLFYGQKNFNLIAYNYNSSCNLSYCKYFCQVYHCVKRLPEWCTDSKSEICYQGRNYKIRTYVWEHSYGKILREVDLTKSLKIWKDVIRRRKSKDRMVKKDRKWYTNHEYFNRQNKI